MRAIRNDELFVRQQVNKTITYAHDRKSPIRQRTMELSGMHDGMFLHTIELRRHCNSVNTFGLAPETLEVSSEVFRKLSLRGVHVTYNTGDGGSLHYIDNEQSSIDAAAIAIAEHLIGTDEFNADPFLAGAEVARVKMLIVVMFK